MRPPGRGLRRRRSVEYQRPLEHRCVMADAIRHYMDQHVPAAVTRGLRERDVDVLTAQEAGR